eukprot:gnl/TRDRNA2_/TRDRNA2_137045_c0_seq1.p1 gnl/TRDRNA2_/TRDRNA2_137045_c0~~gnl/TRDRNA2_/TRDRNA2_137045_c0_seq1.p1  ORF type:complete len:695 (+),score=163.53 gnl/TRDRNA2_/TRDRNA2_137045_c0_seq1:104-2086(+)
MVREGELTSTKKLEARLSTGAIIEEIEVKGERLHYRRAIGTGPLEGWVSIRLPGKDLVVRTDSSKLAATRESAEQTSSTKEEEKKKDDEAKAQQEAEQAAKAAKVAAEPKKPKKEGERDWDLIFGAIADDVFNSLPKYGNGPPGRERPMKMGDFKKVVNEEDEGEYWGIKFPFTPQMLRDMGPKWLTKAMHLTGALPLDNEVTDFVSFDVKAEDVSVQDAENAKWGGAGLKILLQVTYKNGPGEITEGMFLKMPHVYNGKNERFKNSVSSAGMDWSEVTWYNMFGGRFGVLPFKSPKMYFCDMSRRTTNFVNIVERIPYGSKDPKLVGAGEYFPAPEKYKDYALLNNGVDYYYAHAKCLAQFFGWHKVVRETTNQIELTFMDPGQLQMKMSIFAAVAGWGPYLSKERNKKYVECLKDPTMAGIVAGTGFNPQAAEGFRAIGEQFVTETAPHCFPKALMGKAHLDKIWKETGEMGRYCAEMTFFSLMIPEYFTLIHPNAQVDNAFYWRDENNSMQCGLLDWGGVAHGSIPICLGNGWMGAESDMMDEHEMNLVKTFCAEYEVVNGVKLDCDDVHMQMKLAQASVFYGCCANIGMLLRTIPKDQWKSVKGRLDPKINDNFLMRCYYVQIELFLGMWKNRSPYKAFQKWMMQTGMPKKAPTQT